MKKKLNLNKNQMILQYYINKIINKNQNNISKIYKNILKFKKDIIIIG